MKDVTPISQSIPGKVTTQISTISRKVTRMKRNVAARDGTTRPAIITSTSVAASLYGTTTVFITLELLRNEQYFVGKIGDRTWSFLYTNTSSYLN